MKQNKKTVYMLMFMALATITTHAAIVVNDTFGDGDISANTDGIGTGFNTWDSGNGASVSESGGNAIINTPENGGRRAMMTSKDAASVNDATFTRFEFNDVNFSVLAEVNTGLDRMYFGVRGSDNTAYDMQGNPDHGFWIQVESDTLDTGGDVYTGTSALWYKAASGGAFTQLASWTFDTLDLSTSGSLNVTPTLSFALDISAESYALNITGDTISNLSGSLSGSVINDMAGGTGWAVWQQQTENPNLETSIGQIVVTEAIPEPATLGLIAVFGGGVLFIRRRFMI